MSAQVQLADGYMAERWAADEAYLQSLNKIREENAARFNTLIPTNTRTTQVATGLTTGFTVGDGALADAFPRIVVPKRKVKQYVFGQDHFRRGTALQREPGTTPRMHESRISNLTFQTQGYGLRVRATGEEMKEADEGIDVLQTQANGARDNLNLELEVQLQAHLVGAQYATGHTATVTNWDNASGDPVGDVATAIGVIFADCGAIRGGEFVLYLGYDGWQALKQNGDITDRWGKFEGNGRSALPDEAFVAASIGVSKIVVSQMPLGPAQATTSLPTVTSNTFVWPASDDKAALLYQSTSLSADGTMANGEITAAAVVSQYGKQEDRYTGDASVRGPDGDVEYMAVFDDWAIRNIAVDDVSTPTMIAGYRFDDLLA